MSPPIMTLERLASYTAVDELVGAKPNKRWGRASLTSRRSDGYSIADWFDRYVGKERVRLVRGAILNGMGWSPLQRVYIPKKPESPDFRAIDMPTVLNQAILYLLHDWLVGHAEGVLTKTAVGFRRGMQMHQTIQSAHVEVKKKPFVAVVDIANFFDSIAWELLDRVIEGLPADQDVHGMLETLVRVEVIDRRSGRFLARGRGIPQGLSVSPIFANLVLNEFDKSTAHALSKSGVGIKRYCDDMVLPSPTIVAGRRAVEIVRDRLNAMGLAIKPGTGRVVNTREEPAVWLGISFGSYELDVPQATIDAKASRLQSKIDQGIIETWAVDDVLLGLEQYYRRIIGPARSRALISSIRGGLLSSPPHTRKEGIDRLKELVGEHHHRGQMSLKVQPLRKPDDADGHERVKSAREGRKDLDSGRIGQW